MESVTEIDAATQVVLSAVTTLAQTDLDVSSIIASVENIRQDSRNVEIATQELRLLARTAMEPEEIAASIFFIRDGHDRGAPLHCYGPPGLMGAAPFDFVYDKKTNTMKEVPHPADAASTNPLVALKLAILLRYTRTAPGVWKDQANFG